MELPIKINKENGIPLYIQLEEQIRLLIHRGILKEGDPLPTVKSLSQSLEINTNTVTRVYKDLQHQKVLDLKRGVGSFVAQGQTVVEEKDMEELEQKVDELIALSKKFDMEPAELSQLIEIRWKKL